MNRQPCVAKLSSRPQHAVFCGLRRGLCGPRFVGAEGSAFRLEILERTIHRMNKND